MFRHKMFSLLQEMLVLMIGPLLLLPIHMNFFIIDLILLKKNKSKLSSLPLENEYLVFVEDSQFTSIISFWNDDGPFALALFEFLHEKESQIYVPLIDKEPCDPFEEEIHASTQVVVSESHEEVVETNSWVLKRYKALNIPPILQELPLITLDIILNSTKKMTSMQKSILQPCRTSPMTWTFNMRMFLSEYFLILWKGRIKGVLESWKLI